MGKAPGYNTTIRLTGDPVSTTGESMADTGNGTKFETEAYAKSIWNPEASVTVYDNGSPVNSSNYTIRYLVGIVEFDTAPTGPVTADFEYLPSYNIANLYTNSMNRTYETVDTSVFREQGKTREYGLQQIEVTMGRLEANDTTPLDGGGGSEDSLDSLLTNDPTNPLVYEYMPEGKENLTSGARNGDTYRAWVIHPSKEGSVEVDGRYEGELTFVSSMPSDVNGETVRLFDSFGSVT